MGWFSSCPFEMKTFIAFVSLSNQQFSLYCCRFIFRYIPFYVIFNLNYHCHRHCTALHCSSFALSLLININMFKLLNSLPFRRTIQITCAQTYRHIHCRCVTRKYPATHAGMPILCCTKMDLNILTHTLHMAHCTHYTHYIHRDDGDDDNAETVLFIWNPINFH